LRIKYGFLSIMYFHWCQIWQLDIDGEVSTNYLSDVFLNNKTGGGNSSCPRVHHIDQFSSIYNATTNHIPIIICLTTDIQSLPEVLCHILFEMYSLGFVFLIFFPRIDYKDEKRKKYFYEVTHYKISIILTYINSFQTSIRF